MTFTKDSVPFVQISRTFGRDGNEVHISIIKEPGVHLRVALTPEQFAEAMFGGIKTECRPVRWNIDPVITCPQCGNYVPGHATGAGDICTCEPITT